MITPKKALTIYTGVSAVIAVFARPGYAPLSGVMILIGGTASSLKLSIESAQDIYYDTLDAGRQFSSGALVVSLFAIGLWLLGGIILYMAARSKWKGGFLVGSILIWIIGSVYNVFWFAIRSV